MTSERPILPWILLSALLVFSAGCATHPPPLPAALPSALPEAWLEPMRQSPCPGPMRANLRMEVRAPGQHSTTIEGSLRAILPDTLWLTAQYGPFRPLFALLATADSAEFLIHREARYWILPRTAVGWDSMTPPAWARALDWGLCPSDLLRRFVPDGPGTMQGNLWEVRGTIPGDSLRLQIRIAPGSASVREIRFLRGGVERLVARMEGETRIGNAWVPAVLDLRLPETDFSLRVEILAVRLLAREQGSVSPFLRPRGWRRVEGGGIVPLPSQP